MTIKIKGQATQRACPILKTFVLFSIFQAFLFLIHPQNALAMGRRETPAKPWDPPSATEPLPPSNSHGEMELRVLSYNIQGLPLEWIDHSRYADIGHILRQMRAAGTAPHIVTIQEAFHSRTAELIEEAGYPYSRQGPPAEGLRFGSGLYILSEFPITDSQWTVFKDCKSWDCTVRKGVLHTRLSVPELPQPLEVYTTHLNSDPESDPGVTPEETLNTRIKQVHDIKTFLFKTKISQAPGLFPADFNFHPGGHDYLFFTFATNMKNATESCVRSQQCTGDNNAEEDWHTSYDHQFYMSGTSPDVRLQVIHFERTFKEKVNGRYLSDHTGLEIHYRLSW